MRHDRSAARQPPLGRWSRDCDADKTMTQISYVAPGEAPGTGPFVPREHSGRRSYDVPSPVSRPVSMIPARYGPGLTVVGPDRCLHGQAAGIAVWGGRLAAGCGVRGPD